MRKDDIMYFILKYFSNARLIHGRHAKHAHGKTPREDGAYARKPEIPQPPKKIPVMRHAYPPDSAYAVMPRCSSYPYK
jgi:hypothetical protein